MPRRYAYTNLSAALRDRSSPLRHYLDERFPDVREVQARYRRDCGALEVDGTRADPATVGSAFDLGIRFATVDDHFPEIALRGFGPTPAAVRMVDDLSAAARHATLAGDRALLARACWALALCVAVYREGLPPGSALARLLGRPPAPLPGLLDLAPAAGVGELTELFALAQTRLLPHLERPVTPGPEFTLSRWCNADADLIAGRLLVDLKVKLGPKSASTGRRHATLARTDLYQVIAYALFDSADRYRLDEVGLYTARYGALVTWPLTGLLRALSGDPDLELAAEREAVRRAVAD